MSVPVVWFVNVAGELQHELPDDLSVDLNLSDSDHGSMGSELSEVLTDDGSLASTGGGGHIADQGRQATMTSQQLRRKGPSKKQNVAKAVTKTTKRLCRKEHSKKLARKVTKRIRRKEPTRKVYVGKVSDNDVLLGRGAVCYRHPGNEAWAAHCVTLKATYGSSTRGKKEMCKEVVNWVKTVRKGNFLKRNDKKGKWYGRWYKVLDATACDKTSQFLREAVKKAGNP